MNTDGLDSVDRMRARCLLKVENAAQILSYLRLPASSPHWYRSYFSANGTCAVLSAVKVMAIGCDFVNWL